MKSLVREVHREVSCARECNLVWAIHDSRGDSVRVGQEAWRHSCSNRVLEQVNVKVALRVRDVRERERGHSLVDHIRPVEGKVEWYVREAR